MRRAGVLHTAATVLACAGLKRDNDAHCKALEEVHRMGRILTLNPPYEGMSAIVNVLGRVGPDEPNNADDVRVVQQLLQMSARGKAIAGSVGVPQLTGRFDAATGFWIF